MSGSKKLCVIIPVHNKVPTNSEIISLKQCKKVLGIYPVYLVYPEGLTITNYTEIYSELILQPVASSWLSSVQEYNKMKRNLANFIICFPVTNSC